jgi:inosine-uridine nucleoside N-ribohydrolase
MALQCSFRCLVAFCLLGCAADGLFAAVDERVPVIIDTDIGTDADDAFALGLALLESDSDSPSPRLEIAGITTCGSDASTRALMVCRMLTATEQDSIPVAAGADPQPRRPIEAQYQYRNHPDVIFNRTKKPEKTDAVEFMYQQLKSRPKEITLVTLGPLTNIARLIEKHPEAKDWIKQLVVRAGAIEVGHDGKPPAIAEPNVKSDVKAAQAVFAAGIPLWVVPIDAATKFVATRPDVLKMLSFDNLVSNQVRTLYELANPDRLTVLEPLAVELARSRGQFGEIRLADWEDRRLEVTDEGLLKSVDGKPNARVAVSSRPEIFFIAHMLGGFNYLGAKRAPADSEPKTIGNPIPRGNFPAHVHAFEDYETDIERRWWMTGVPEKENIPPGSNRACRGMLTHDFDDLQGNRRAMYRAVIFNPVPGPPMGPRTRLSFRYWLGGTDRLRVQLYSLSNGYHRCLTLTDLEQGKWQECTVDMTQMRRPDGSGGPLAEDERIDDIQFYADPRAELIIDDIMLYDAAAEGEQRPFPKRVLFTGWFDTGKQGGEWPGEFEIVPHAPPLKWKAARSVTDPAGGAPRLRVGLRGDRQLRPGPTRLTLRYRLTGGDRFGIQLARQGNRVDAAQVEPAEQDKWTQATVDFIAHADGQAPAAVDEIRFVLPPKAELLVDDLLLFEPGTPPPQ